MYSYKCRLCVIIIYLFLSSALESRDWCAILEKLHNFSLADLKTLVFSLEGWCKDLEKLQKDVGKISVSSRILCRDQGRSNSKNFHFIFSFLWVLIGSISNLKSPFDFFKYIRQTYFTLWNILFQTAVYVELILQCVFSINYCLWWLIFLWLFWGGKGIFTVNSWSLNFICGNSIRI